MAMPKVLFGELLKDHGPLVALGMSALKVGSSPVAFVITKATSGKPTWCLDAIHLSLLALPLLMLWLLPPGSLVYLVWPVLRLIDLQFIYMRSFVYNLPPRSKPRAVLHLFLHYTEVILLFALLYLFMQTHVPGTERLFAKSTDIAHVLSAPQAVFFSFITGATIGYGDISPNHSAERSWVVAVYVLTWLKTLMILSFTLVELARVVGFSSVSGQKT